VYAAVTEKFNDKIMKKRAKTTLKEEEEKGPGTESPRIPCFDILKI